jgi:hypothetical protein
MGPAGQESPCLSIKKGLKQKVKEKGEGMEQRLEEQGVIFAWFRKREKKNTDPCVWDFIAGSGFIIVLLGPLTAACIKAERPQVARRAIELAETRLLKDNWPKYYDGKLGRDIGKQTRKFQTWSNAWRSISSGHDITRGRHDEGSNSIILPWGQGRC